MIIHQQLQNSKTRTPIELHDVFSTCGAQPCESSCQEAEVAVKSVARKEPLPSCEPCSPISNRNQSAGWKRGTRQLLTFLPLPPCLCHLRILPLPPPPKAPWPAAQGKHGQGHRRRKCTVTSAPHNKAAVSRVANRSDAAFTRDADAVATCSKLHGAIIINAKWQCQAFRQVLC